jgi:hypothetical protein
MLHLCPSSNEEGSFIWAKLFLDLYCKPLLLRVFVSTRYFSKSILLLTGNATNWHKRLTTLSSFYYVSNGIKTL